MKPAEVVVLGGRGFIGRHLTQQLLAQGIRVKIVSRQSEPGLASDPRLSYARGDVSDLSSMLAATAGASVVFHLATGGGDTWAQFERDFVEGARNVAAACLENGVTRLVYTSSTAALYLGGHRSIDETAGTDSVPESRGHYSHAKILAERVLLKEFEKRRLPVVILRPGLVVGEGGILNHGGLGLWPCDVHCLGWGRGNHPLPFVLVQDVASALVAAMTAPGIEGMAFNLAGDVRPSAAQFVSALSERSFRRICFHPQWLWKMQAIEIGKWLLKALARKPENSFPSFRDLKSRTMRAPLDCSAAKEKLSWTPNADWGVFVNEAIDSNLTPMPCEDLRLAKFQTA